MVSNSIKDRTTIATKDHGNPVQIDNDAVLGAASKDKRWQKLRKKTAHIGRKGRHATQNSVDASSATFSF